MLSKHFKLNMSQLNSTPPPSNQHLLFSVNDCFKPKTFMSSLPAPFFSCLTYSPAATALHLCLQNMPKLCPLITSTIATLVQQSLSYCNNHLTGVPISTLHYLLFPKERHPLYM